MCLLIIWVDDERFEGERAKMSKRRRPLTRFWHQLTSIFSPREIPPPKYNEETSSSQSNTKALPVRPDSLTLPKYESIRSYGGVRRQMKEESTKSIERGGGNRISK